MSDYQQQSYKLIEPVNGKEQIDLMPLLRRHDRKIKDFLEKNQDKDAERYILEVRTGLPKDACERFSLPDARAIYLTQTNALYETQPQLSSLTDQSRIPLIMPLSTKDGLIEFVAKGTLTFKDYATSAEVAKHSGYDEDHILLSKLFSLDVETVDELLITDYLVLEKIYGDYLLGKD